MTRGERFYRAVSIVGIQSARILKRFVRRLGRIAAPFAALFAHLWKKGFGSWSKNYREYRAAARADDVLIRKQMQEAKSEHFLGRLQTAAAAVLAWFWSRRKIFGAVFNVAAPVAAILILFLTASYWNSFDFALQLDCGERSVVIRDEAVYEEAAEILRGRMAFDTLEETNVNLIPGFSLVKAVASMTDAQTLCDILIENTGNVIEEASGLYVNGKLIGAVKSRADLTLFLNALYEEARVYFGGETAGPVENVSVVDGLYASASIKNIAKLSELVCGSSTDTFSYTAKSGDTLESIACQYGMAPYEILKLNEAASGGISEGMILLLKKQQPLITVSVTKTVTYEADIPYSTVTVKDDEEYSDYSDVRVSGENGTQECTDKVYYVNGLEVKRENLSSKVLTDPVDKVVAVGTLQRPTGEVPGEASGLLMWPTPTLWTVTSEFGPRWGTNHQGMDISGSGAYGAPIVASDAGVVSYVSYSQYGYGYHVIIDHGNGYSTLYGHTSEILVSEGEKVYKGETIAYVGNTGDSLGAHLHFEIMIWGEKVDPAPYIS